MSIFAAAGSQDLTLRVDVPLVSLDVSVTDPDGRAVEALKSTDFEVLENGVRQEVSYFGSSSAPYHVFLLFDTSGSTYHQWDFMRRAVDGLAASLKAQDKIAVGVFDSRLTILSDWDTSPEETMEALKPVIEEGDLGGTTEFYRSVERVIERGFDDVHERRALIVLTDGRDTTLWRELVRRNRLVDPERDDRFMDLYSTAEGAGIPVYFIALNTAANLEENPAGGDEYRNLKTLFPDSSIPEEYLNHVRIRMERVAAVSGGEILFPSNIEEVISLFEGLAGTLGQAYSLGYTPQPARPGEGRRQIQVTVGDASYTIRQSRESFQPR